MEMQGVGGLVRCVAVSSILLVATACGSNGSDVAVPVPDPSPISTPGTTDEILTPSARASSRAVAVESRGVESEAAVDHSSSITDPPVVVPEPVVVPDSTLPPSTTVAPVDTTASPSTTESAPPAVGPGDAGFAMTLAAFQRLADDDEAATITVVSGGEVVLSKGSGRTTAGAEVSGDSPMVVASVSKVVVAVAVARLAERGLIDVSAPVPWADIGLTPVAGWDDVTVRELLDHTGGLSKDRDAWFDEAGTCRDHVPNLLQVPPNDQRGKWYYSNGNYCLLGLLVEQRSGHPLGEALQELVFDPVGVDGAHLTDEGVRPDDVPYGLGLDVARLSRLGGAGTLMISTDDIARIIATLTPADTDVLRPPGVFTDQYGFGHTGTVDGARACVWALAGGSIVVAVTIAGEGVGSGGALCDVIVPAVADDFGIGQGRPVRVH